MSKHVNAGLALFEDDVTDKRLIFTVRRFHFDKGNLIEDRTKAFNLNAHRAANLSSDCFPRSGFNFDFCGSFKNA